MALEVKAAAEIVSIFTNTTLSCAATATSPGIDLTNCTYFGAWIKGSSAGASAVTGVYVWFEQSYDEIAANYVVPDGTTPVLSGVTNANLARIVSISPVPMTYIRFKATATTANSADAVLNMKLFIQ